MPELGARLKKNVEICYNNWIELINSNYYEKFK